MLNGEGPLKTSFVEENGGRLIENDLKPYQSTFFPQGLLHMQQNLGCNDLQFLSALNSEDPGVLTLPNALLRFNRQSLAASFNQNTRIIKNLSRRVKNGPVIGDTACLARCRTGSP